MMNLPEKFIINVGQVYAIAGIQFTNKENYQVTYQDLYMLLKNKFGKILNFWNYFPKSLIKVKRCN